MSTKRKKTRGMVMRVDSVDSTDRDKLVLVDYENAGPVRRVTIDLNHATVCAVMFELKRWADAKQREANTTRGLFS